MLYQIGAVTLDTRPFNADRMERTARADFAVKPLIGTLPGREFMGEGDDEIALSGQILPSKTGGLAGVEMLHGFRVSGTALPVMRGDGRMFGWYVIEEVRESHRELLRSGVGFTVDYSVRLLKSAPASASVAVVGTLLSLFGALGR